MTDPIRELVVASDPRPGLARHVLPMTEGQALQRVAAGGRVRPAWLVKGVRVNGHSAPRPVVPLEMTYAEGRSLKIPAILDSGATDSIMPAGLLPPDVRFDDLPDRPSHTLRGFGARVPGRRWKVDVSLFGTVFSDHIWVYADPLDRDGYITHACLGLTDMWRHFDIDFRWRADGPVVIIAPVKQPAAAPPVEGIQEPRSAPLLLPERSGALPVPERLPRAQRRAMARVQR